MIKDSFFIPVRVYSCEVLLMYGYTKAEAIKKIKRLVHKSDLKTAIEIIEDAFAEDHKIAGCVYTISTGLYICFLFPCKRCKMCLHETVSHEMFHATSRILRDRNVFLVKESEEAFAYLLGFLVKNVIDILKKNKVL